MDRLWALPLWAHAVGLTLVLLLLAPFVGTSASFSADEGAAVAQARTLARDGEWIRPHPFPAVDPDDRMYPLENSGAGEKGRAPFVRHPLYALLLSAADRLGGVTAMVLLSVVGTVLAALFAGLLARRLDVEAGPAALWVTGLASPLLFDGYLVIAHTLGAACAGGAALAALKFLDERPGWASIVVLPIAVAVLLRSEAVLYAGALGIGLIVAGWRRVARARAILLGGAVMVAGAVAHVAETAWQRAILGGSGASVGLPDVGGGLLETRLDAFVATWLSPGDGRWSTGDLVLLVTLVVTAAAAVELRRGETRVAVVLVTTAAVLALLRLATGPTDVVPGLLVAFPLGAFGLVLVRRAGLLGVTAAVFVLAVVASQFERGGTTEWGGRYFALALPVAVPLLVVGIRQALAGVERPARLAIATGLAVQAAALGALGMGALRAGHQRTSDLLAAVEQLAPGDGAVVLTGNGAVPRLAWSLLDGRRWLLVQGVAPDVLAARLQAEGVAEVTVVDPIGRTELRTLPGYRIGDERDGGRARQWRVTLLRAA